MIKRGFWMWAGVVLALAAAWPAVAATDIAAPTSASSFMSAELGLLLHGVLWVVLGVLGLGLFILAYLLLRWGMRKGLAGRRMRPETLTALSWIVLPLVLLVFLVVPAIELIYHNDEPPYVTVSVTAHEWYWDYDYVSEPGLGFASHVVEKTGGVDHPLMLPVGKKVRFLVSSGDVLHGFFVPQLGVQIYAVPGALLNGWTIIEKPGIYEGHSSSICGTNHPQMPIEIKAVPLKDYQAWVAQTLANSGAKAP
jgi:heme/copper-type cytochrome/quinol oxidase subunit 2